MAIAFLKEIVKFRNTTENVAGIINRLEAVLALPVLWNFHLYATLPG